MQVSIETLDGLERRMTVQIPSEQVSEAVEKKLKDLSKTVKVDGFRPGKVPLKVVQQKYGGYVRQEVIGEVIESSYQEALIQEQVRPAGMPSIDSISSEETAGGVRDMPVAPSLKRKDLQPHNSMKLEDMVLPDSSENDSRSSSEKSMWKSANRSSNW